MKKGSFTLEIKGAGTGAGKKNRNALLLRYSTGREHFLFPGGYSVFRPRSFPPETESTIHHLDIGFFTYDKENTFAR